MKYLFILGFVLCGAVAGAQDLKITSATIPTSIRQYEQFSAMFQISSATAINTQVLTNVYFSTDNLLDNADIFAGSITVASMNAGQSTAFAVSGGFTKSGVDVDPGSYFVIAQVDYNDAVVETDENNTFSTPVNVFAATVDLTFANPTVAERDLSQGNVIGISYQIQNLGAHNIANIYTTFYLTTTPGATQPRAQQWTNLQNELNWSSPVSVGKALPIPYSLAAGEYYLYGVIEDQGQGLTIEESNTGNNTASFGSITVDDPNIDLAVSSLTLTPVSEKKFQYSFTRSNSGTSALHGYSLRLTFSADATLDASDNFSFTVPFNPQDPDQHVGGSSAVPLSETYTATSPVGYLPVGSWYVFADINNDHLVPEANFTNNLIRSSNKINVSAYTITFATAPIVTDITDHSFTINTTPEADMLQVHYLVLPDGATAPVAAAMRNSAGLFPWETQTTIDNLGPAFAYDVYFMGEYYDQKVTSILKIDVTTTGIASPTIRLPESELMFNAENKDQESVAKTYNVYAYHLTAPVTVTASGNFGISKDGDSFSNELVFNAAEFTQGASEVVYVKYLPSADPGIVTGSVAHTTEGASLESVAVSIPVYNPYDCDFEGFSQLEQTGWTAYSVTGFQSWSLADLVNGEPNHRPQTDDKAMQMDGSINEITTNEDWLISPPTDLSDFAYNPTVKFRAYSTLAGPSLKLKYSANYTGTGDPNLATWFDSEAVFPASNSSQWQNASSELLLKESKIYFAFVYTSTATEASRWSIDNWKITDNLLSIPAFTLAFQNVDVGTTSASQSLPVKIVGYGDVTVSVTEGFEVSLDNKTFGVSVVIPEADAEAGTGVYFRFKPVREVTNLKGTMTFEATDMSATRETLVGSSNNVTGVEALVEVSNFIYPNPTDGPVRVSVEELNGASAAASYPVIVTNSVGLRVASFDSRGDLDTQLSNVMGRVPPGLYYVVIRTRETLFTDKLVKR